MAAEQHDPEWYIDRPVPERLLKNLAELPIIPEELLLNPVLPNCGVRQSIERRRDGGTLTPRESQCLALMSHGMTRQMVADALEISEQTVMTHLKRARFVLRGKNTMHAVAIALREGIIE